LVAAATNDLQGSEAAHSGDEADISDAGAIPQVENAEVGAAARVGCLEKLNVAAAAGETAVQFSQLRTLRDCSGHVAIAQAIQPCTRGFGLQILHESEGAHVHAYALQNTLQKAAVHYGNIDFSVMPDVGCSSNHGGVERCAGARENDAAVKGEVAYDGVQSAGGQRLEAITWLPRLLLLLLRINPPGDGTRFSR
jgi:hypothetical protein